MKALEFFSGIGGLRYALLQACPSATIIAAYDINDIANQVYTHNFGHAPLSVDVCSLTAAQLDGHAADVWLLSPPCQPYTRRGLQLQSADTRSAGFLGILTQLQAMKFPPKYILLENVVGFEASDTRGMLCAVLHQCNFDYQEFLLSPSQLGIPYSRPRYFGLAKHRGTKKGSSNPFKLENLPNGLPFTAPPSQLVLSKQKEKENGDGDHSDGNNTGTPMETTVSSLGSFLAQSMSNLENNNSHLLCSSATSLEDLFLSKETLIKHGWCLDLVGPHSTRVNCITKAYSHFLKGSGSVLATENVNMIPEILEKFPVAGSQQQHKGSDDDGKSGEDHNEFLKEEENAAAFVNKEAFVEALENLKLRFLSPGEVAALHSFPPPPLFSFPKGVTLRQRYQLLGNSLSTAVVADLLIYLFSE